MNNKTPFELRHEALLIAKDNLSDQYFAQRNRIENKLNYASVLPASKQKELAESVDKEIMALKFPDTEAILEEAKKFSHFIEGHPRRN